MKTIKMYQKLETSELQSRLLKLETLLECNELSIDNKKIKNEDFNDLKKISDDYEIDISLIRMELTKRFWYND